MIFWVIIIIIVIIVLSSRKKTNVRTGKVNYDYYWNLEREIFAACFDRNTTVFYWRTWFDRRDEIIHTAPLEVLKDIDSEFRHYGRLQIYTINAILSNWLYGNCDLSLQINKLKREILDTGIYVNLCSMYSFQNGIYNIAVCPKEVTEYTNLLRDFMYPSKGSITKDKAKRVVDLGNYITNHY